MQTVTLTLTHFLLARVAEDEDYGARHPDWCRSVADDQACDCDGLARVLAECAAKRKIVSAWGSVESQGIPQISDPPYVAGVSAGLREAVEHLAAVYADHPDYREEWRP